MRWMWSLLLCVTMLCSSAPAGAEGQKQVVLVLANRLGEADLAQMPHLQELAASGAVGLMNVNTGGARTDANAYATMAFGAPSRMAEAQAVAVNAGEKNPAVAVAVFGGSVADGTADAGGTGVLVPTMPKLLREQSKREFAGSIGGIGERLRAHGLQAAVFGTSDRGEVVWRPGALFTTDREGRTPLGDVGTRMLKSSPGHPYGVHTDYAEMWKAYQQVRGEAALTVFDLGDLSRLHEYRGRMTEDRLAALRGQELAEMDAFLGKVVQEATPNRLVIVAAPQVSTQAAENREWLSLILEAGGDVKAGTVLTSATTRREGIVSNLDVAPTILHFLGVEQEAGMIGYPLQTTAKVEQAKLDGVYQATVWTYQHRAVVLTALGVLAGIGLLAAVAWWWNGVAMRSVRWVRVLLFTVLAMPLCLYVLPLLRPDGLWEVAGGVVALFLLFVAIPFAVLPACRTLTGRLLWLAAWTAGVVVFDVWQGGMLARASLLSYDPIVGARYYGIGNEYMGVLVGAAVLVYGSLRQSGRFSARVLGWSGVAVGVVLTAFFASPLLGTNTGGALTMAATVALCAAAEKRMRIVPALGLLAGALGGAVALLFLLNQTAAHPSHIGAATHQMLEGGLQEALRIVARKSDMFGRLFTSSIWPTVLLVLLGWFASYTHRSRGRTHGALRTVIGSLVGGAVVGLCTNDSGIVVVAMMMIFSLLPTLLIWLEEEAEVIEQWSRQGA
ncbi:MAG: hypothetical protein WCC10_07040 [Tumebacillaceae bacterium]